MDTKELTRGDYEMIVADHMHGAKGAPLVFVLPGVPVLWDVGCDLVPEDWYPGFDLRGDDRPSSVIEYRHHECPIADEIEDELTVGEFVFVDFDDTLWEEL